MLKMELFFTLHLQNITSNWTSTTFWNIWMKWLEEGKAVQYEDGAVSVWVPMVVFPPAGYGGQNFSSFLLVLFGLKWRFLK